MRMLKTTTKKQKKTASKGASSRKQLTFSALFVALSFCLAAFLGPRTPANLPPSAQLPASTVEVTHSGGASIHHAYKAIPANPTATVRHPAN
jgi:hypothetical protein